MKNNELRRKTNGFVFACGIVLTLFLGQTTVRAAAVPEEADWSLWLQEGNTGAFLQELEKIAQCVKAENVDVKSLPASVSDMTPCQQQVRSAQNYRDPEGHELLQTYLKYSGPDTAGEPSSIPAIVEATAVINALLSIGMTLVDWEREQPDFDNLFFLAIKYNKFGLLNQLFAATKKFDSEKLSKLSTLRSSQGVRLADAILAKKPDEMSSMAMIMNYKLVSDINEVTHKTGLAYTGLKVMLMGKTEL